MGGSQHNSSRCTQQREWSTWQQAAITPRSWPWTRDTRATPQRRQRGFPCIALDGVWGKHLKRDVVCVVCGTEHCTRGFSPSCAVGQIGGCDGVELRLARNECRHDGGWLVCGTVHCVSGACRQFQGSSTRVGVGEIAERIFRELLFLYISMDFCDCPFM